MYFPPKPEEIYPRVMVEPRQLVSWKENPTTAALLSEINRRIYSLNCDALRASASPVQFELKRGEAVAYIGILEYLGIMEQEILHPEEDEGTE